MPGAALFGAVAAARRALYRRGVFRAQRLACPVVVVGNLSVGGTGKTPLVAWLVRKFAARGRRCGVVTRGYGGSERAPQLIDGAADPSDVGDEAVLLARQTGAPVAVGRDRPAAAQLLIDAGCDLIFSDDGLQHYALLRNFEVIVVDGDRLFGNGWLLPAGPLRERTSRLDTAGAIVVTGGRALIDGAFSMRLHADRAVALTRDASRPLSDFAGHRVHALAGIGHPERFFNMLRAHGIEVQGRSLDDHAPITRAALDFGDEAPVLMTQKDAVKCEASADARHWYIPVEAQFALEDAQSLLARIAAKIEMAAAVSAPAGEKRG